LGVQARFVMGPDSSRGRETLARAILGNKRPDRSHSKARFTMGWRGGTMQYVDLERTETTTFQCGQLGYTGLISYATAKEKAGS
jgi:hypothetical protein